MLTKGCHQQTMHKCIHLRIVTVLTNFDVTINKIVHLNMVREDEI